METKINNIHAIALSYVSAFTAFITTIIIARLLTAEEFAFIALAMAVGSFAAPLINIGTDRVFVGAYISSKSPVKKSSLLNNNIKPRIIAATLVICLLITMANWISESTNALVGHSTLFVWAALMGIYPTAWFDAIGRTSLQNSLNLIEKIAALLAIIIIYYVPLAFQDIVTVGLVLLAIRLLGIVGQYLIWKRINKEANPSAIFKYHKGEANGLSIYLTGVALFNSCVAYGNQLFLKMNDGGGGLAAYGIAFQGINLVILFQGQFLRLLMRDIAKKSMDENFRLSEMSRHLIIMLFASSVLATLAWVMLSIMPLIINDERYKIIRNFSLYLCMWSVVAGVGQVITQYTIAKDLQREYLQTSATAAIAAIIFGVYFVPLEGPKAVAILLLVIHSAMILKMTYHLWRKTRVK